MSLRPHRSGRSRRVSAFHARRVALRNEARRAGGPVKRGRHQAAVRERRTRILVALTVALGFELSAAALTSPMLGINKITVRASAPLPGREEAVTRLTAALPPGSNLLRAPLGQMEQKLRALPWVRTASVRWQSPHALAIRFTPRQPAVVAVAGDAAFEVDEGGMPIRVARDNAAQELPRVELDRPIKLQAGLPLQDASVLAAIGIYHDAPSQPMVRIAKIKVDSAGNLCLNMMDGIRVDLGQPDQLAAKLKYVNHVYQLDPNIGTRMVGINLSVPKQPACTMKADVQAAAAQGPQPAPASTGGPPVSPVAL